MGHRRDRQCKSHARGLRFVAHGGRYVLVGVVRNDIIFLDPEFHKCEAINFASRNAQPNDVVEQMENGPALFGEWSLSGGGVIKAIFEVGWISEFSLVATITRAKPPASMFK